MEGATLARRYTTELVSLYNQALDAVERRDKFNLGAAPVLTGYVPVKVPTGRIFMFGNATDHPLLGNTLISTSDLVWLDHDAKIARTVSRFYRVEAKADFPKGSIVAAGYLWGRVLGDEELQCMLRENADRFRKLMN